MAKKIIEIKNVSKSYGDNVIIENLNLYINKGEFVTVLGPSGCGKSTTLRMVAGFEIPTSGEILLNGKDITNLPPHKRPINTVFQRYALFPHLDVYDNVAFGLKLKRVPNEKKPGKVRKLTAEEIDQKVLNALFLRWNMNDLVDDEFKKSLERMKDLNTKHMNTLESYYRNALFISFVADQIKALPNAMEEDE
jgi:ABC-type sugar transport system ATPase subunit